MAGEDPGAGVFTLILDLIRRGWDIVTSTVKTVLQTGLMVYFRKQMLHAQQGPKLKHGKQSLKSLRRHEERGAQLVSVEIGDRDAMKALDRELKGLKIDYAITKDKDGEYTLHYKTVNEKDVLLAQRHALEKRFGDPNATQEELQTPNEERLDPDTQQQDQRDREEREREQQDREQQDREQIDESSEQQQDDQGREQIDESGEQQNQQETLDQQEREQADDSARQQETLDQQQRDSDNQREQSPAAPLPRTQSTQPEGTAHERGRSEHAASAGAPTSGRAHTRTASSPKHAKTQAEPHAELANAPLDKLIEVARERARAKNLARSQDRGIGLDHHRSRSRDHFLGK